MSKEYENRYWEISDDGLLVGELHFTQYAEHDFITADNPNDAMEQFEDMIIEYIEGEIAELEDMLDKFNEEKI